QRAACLDLHGRYRLARAWRHDRYDRGRHQARNRAGGGRRFVRAGGGFGSPAGGLLVVHRPAGVSCGSPPPSLLPRPPHPPPAPAACRAARLGRAADRDALLDRGGGARARRIVHAEIAVMVPVTAFAGKKVAVFGLGGSGLASAGALLAGGADVVGWDDSAETVARASSAGIPTADLRHIDWSRISALVLAPGV